MTAKLRSHLVQTLYALAANLVLFPLWLVVQLPQKMRMAVGRALGRAIMRLSKSTRVVTATNIRLCFPELSAENQEKLMLKSFESLGMGFIEMGMAWWLPKQRASRLVTMSGLEHAEQAHAHGKGLIILGLHLTPMEFVGGVMSDHIDFHPMYQATKNPFIDEIIRNKRQRIYNKEIIPNTKIRSMVKFLRNNEAVWYAPDQSPSDKRCVFAPFFGISAASATTTAYIARLSEAPVLPSATYRLPDYSGYLAVLHPAIKDFPLKNEADSALCINQIAEQLIREHPEQYLWQYKRFKKRPPGAEHYYH